MSQTAPTGNDRPDALGDDDPAVELARLRKTLDGVLEKLERVDERVRYGNDEPPERRKYTYEEAGVRLTTGRDPLDVDPDDWDACLSADSVRRLCEDGDCPLRAVRIGGKRTVRITEAEIRKYESSVEAGIVDGYQVKQPRKHRK
jgi:hypothetical protein